MRSCIYLLFVFACSTLSAQFHQPVLEGIEGDELFNQLQSNYTPVFILSYSQARTEMYSKIDNTNDTVTCVYSGYKKYVSPSSLDPIGDLIQGGSNGINCEHSYPQSKGAGSGNARSDMHHLYPARAGVNEARSNHPFAEIDDQETQNWYFEDIVRTSIPFFNIDAHSERRGSNFEAREDHKGNVARSMFYFYTIYRDQANAADDDFFPPMISTLCDWHLLDPVDQKEWDRTFAIAEFQEDIPNPFVLDCTLAERLYCDGQSPCETTSTENPAKNFFELEDIFPNPSDAIIQIPYSIKKQGQMKISVINLFGQKIATLINQKHEAGAYQLSWDVSETSLNNNFLLIKFEFSNEKGRYVNFKKIFHP